jgi:hypothetical protein
MQLGAGKIIIEKLNIPDELAGRRWTRRADDRNVQGLRGRSPVAPSPRTSASALFTGRFVV